MVNITTYKASDGVEVSLTPDNVAAYILTGYKQVPQKDIISFMAKCKARKLNPFAGDAYMTAYKDKQGRVSTSVVVSKDYFIRTATQRPTFDGFKAGVIVVNNGQLVYREGSFVLSSEQLVGGWAEVYDKERKYPTRAEVSFAEYNKGKSTWLAIPATMIRKVALVQALRETYPANYGGIYDADEMPEPSVQAVPPAPVEVVAEVEASEPESVEVEAEPEPVSEQAAFATEEIKF